MEDEKCPKKYRCKRFPLFRVHIKIKIVKRIEENNNADYTGNLNNKTNKVGSYFIDFLYDKNHIRKNGRIIYPLKRKEKKRINKDDDGPNIVVQEVIIM